MVRALIAGLCIAAAAAIAALLAGEFGDTHARIVGTSLGFSFFCALAAAGESLRAQADGALATAGGVASGLAEVAFCVLVAAIWVGDSDVVALWRAWGVVAVLALWASHWSIVLRARRPADSAAVRLVWQISIATATFDMLVGNIAIAGLVEDVSDAFARVLGVVLVITVLTTILPPIMRALAGHPGRGPAGTAVDARRGRARADRGGRADRAHQRRRRRPAGSRSPAPPRGTRSRLTYTRGRTRFGPRAYVRADNVPGQCVSCGNP